MKICILTTSFPRYRGDYAGAFVLDLAMKMAEGGMEVRVVAPGEAGAAAEEQIGPIRVSRFTYMIPRNWQRMAYGGGIPSNLRKQWLAWAQMPLFFLSFFIRGLGACQGCDIIHAYWIFAGFVAVMLSAACAKPSVLTVQGSDVNALFGNRWLRWFRSYVVRRVARVIAVSTPLAERVRELGADAHQIALIPNGVDTTAFSDSEVGNGFEYRLLWVGRLSAEKGVEFLVEAMAQVAKEFPQARLTLVGDGPRRDDIERLITRLALNGRVHLTGLVPHHEIPTYLKRSDLFILPSLSEGLPLVLGEAMSAGKPVVATCVGGIPDVVVGEGSERTGYLVPAANASALAQAIGDVFSDPQKARVMGQNGRKRIERQYAWSHVARQTIDLYQSVLRR